MCYIYIYIYTQWIIHQLYLSKAVVGLFFFFLADCGILVPQQGSNPYPLQWKHGVLTIRPPVNSKVFLHKLNVILWIKIVTYFHEKCWYVRSICNHSWIESIKYFPLIRQISPKGVFIMDRTVNASLKVTTWNDPAKTRCMSYSQVFPIQLGNSV